MKKLVSIMLILAVTFGCLTVTYADEALESLTLSVKQRLEIPEKYTEFSTNTRWDNNGDQTVNFEWATLEDDYISVTAEMDGVITDYYNTVGEIKKRISKVSSKKAAEIANAFMNKINPQISSEYEFYEEDVEKSYGISVAAERFVGNARVDGNQASITLDTETGDVVTFYVYRDDYDFESQEGIISLDDAKAKFGDLTDLSLCYINGKDGNIIPVYMDYKTIYDEEFGLDAFTGEGVYYTWVYENTGGAGGSANDKVMGSGGGSSADIVLTDKELEDLSKYEKYVSKEEAEKKLRSIKEFGLEGLTLQSASYGEKYTYRGDLLEEDGVNLSLNFTGKVYARAILDAETGEIMSFYRTQEGGEDKIDSEKAEKTADEFVKKYCNKPYVKTNVFEKGNLSRNIYFEEIDGIPYIDGETSVFVDLTSGYISNYSNGFNKYDKSRAVEPDEVIANNMARKVYFDYCEYELVYIDINGTTAMPLYKIEVKVEDEPVYKLFYRIRKKPYAVDALTGELLNVDGGPYEEVYKSFKDIDGHWCETAVEALVDSGYMEVLSPNFNPNDAITVEDANKMLSMANLYHDRIEESEMENITRTEAVKAIICGAGYEKVGALSDVYKPVFADSANIASEDVGYVALAKGLGIVSGDQNGNFNPQTITTKASFAVMIYNYILSESYTN